MASFLTDIMNFGEGYTSGTRIVPDTGVKLDFDEHAPDGATLGLWHLHNGYCEGEGTGLEDFSGGSHAFQNHGAEPTEDGYRFVRESGHYMDGSFPAQPSRSLLTLECWVQGVIVASGTRAVASYGLSANNYLYILFTRHATDPSLSYIVAGHVIGGAINAYAQWQGAGAEAVFLGTAPWHVALVLDAPNSLRLFVNGIQRAQDTRPGIVALPAGDCTLKLGRYISGWSGYDLSAVLDEVRLSAAARYAAPFAPHRLLASGVYTSPTFDSERAGAEWASLIPSLVLPPDCLVAWDARAADATDAGGEPLADWQPYSGGPLSLPCGRWFQWRATLSGPSDRLATPTLVSVEAVLSERGYRIYHATGQAPEALDYAEPWIRVGPGITGVQTPPLDAGGVHWFGIRPVRADGVETPVTEAEVRLELDAFGLRVPERPAGVLNLCASPISGGRARLVWTYRVGATGAAPAAFRLFSDQGTGTVDYSTPVDEVPYQGDRMWFSWTSGVLPDGVTHQLAVRAVALGGVTDEQSAVVGVTPDASAPGQVETLQAEVVL